MARIKITTRYKQYPLSEKLTQKSYIVASFTHPLFGFGLGIVLSFALAIALNVSSGAFDVLLVMGMVGGPIAFWIIRVKKFAQYDAEYAKILQEQEKKNTEKKFSAVNQIKNGYEEPAVQRQPVYQQPVQQQPVYQQPVYQQPVYNNAGSGMKTLDEQIDEICRIAIDNISAQNDPQIHWECAQKLEQMLQAHPAHEGLQREVAQNLANYSWTSTARPFSERRRAYNASLRSLTLEKRQRETTELDRRKFCLIFHAVFGGTDAANLNDVNAMEEALQWLRTAATYKMEEPDAERQQYQNVAIPSVRFYVGYCLAKAYLEQTSPQKQKAKAIIEEALQACPYALIRQCDLNPNRNTDTSTVITRENMMSLLQVASQ